MSEFIESLGKESDLMDTEEEKKFQVGQKIIARISNSEFRT